VQVCKNNWVRIITAAGKRRMDGLRVEVGVKESLKKKLMTSGFKWASHVENGM